MKASGNFTDVVWIQTGFIGDVALNSGAIAKLHELSPETRQHFVTTRIGAEIYARDARLTSLHVFDKRNGAFEIARTAVRIRGALAKFKGARPQRPIVLQPHRSYRSSLLAHALRAPIATYHETGLSWAASKRIERIAALHEKDRIAILMQALGFHREEIIPCSLSLPRDGAKTKLTPATIGVAPGSVWGTKRWPVEYYAEFVEQLLRNTQFSVVLIGSSQEAADALTIENTLKARGIWLSDRIANRAGATSIPELMSLIASLTALVCNDSSPIHFASAYQVPTLAMFGSTVPAMGFSPQAQHSRVAEVDIDCRPCSVHGPMVCPLGHFKCMRTLTPDRVWNEFQNLMRDLPFVHS